MPVKALFLAGKGIIWPFRPLQFWWTKHDGRRLASTFFYDGITLALFLLALFAGENIIEWFHGRIAADVLESIKWIHSKAIVAGYLLFAVAFLRKCAVMWFR